MMFADVNGDFVNSQGKKRGNIKGGDHFARNLRGEACLSEPFLSTVTGNVIVVVAVPVKDKGKIVGSMMGSLKLQSISDRVLSSNPGTKGQAVVRKDGLIMVHPDSSYVMKQNELNNGNSNADLRRMTERMIKGEKGVLLIRDPKTNNELYYSFAPVSDTVWSLAQFMSKDVIDKETRVLTMVSAITIVAVIILSGLLVRLVCTAIDCTARRTEGCRQPHCSRRYCGS